MKLQMGHLSLLSATLVIPFEVFGEWYTGGGVIYGLVDADVTYDSNIHTNSSEVQSVIYTLTPGVQYIRDEGYVRLESEAGVVLSHYTDRKRYNSQDPYARLSLLMPFRDEDYPLAARGTVEYADQMTPDPTVGRRVERTLLQAEGGADYRFHEYFLGRMAASYEYYDYEVSSDPDFPPAQGGAYPTSNLAALELGGAYRYSAHLNFGLSGRVRWTDHDMWKSTDYAVFAVAEGLLMPRTTGTVRVGGQFRSFDSTYGDDEWTPYVSVSLQWDVDDNTAFILSAVSDYQPTSANESVASRSLALTLRQQLIAKINGYVTANIQQLELDNPGVANRKDDVFYTTLGAEYTLTELASLNGQLNIEWRDSDVESATYERLVAQIGLRLRY